MRTVEDITHTQCICVCVAQLRPISHSCIWRKVRGREYVCEVCRVRRRGGGQEQWSHSRTWRTGASVWTRTPTYQHAHAHLRSRARGVGNKWEYVAESTVLTCSVSQGGVGKTLILTKLQGRGGGEIIDNQQVTERGEVQLPVWRGLPAHSEAAKIFLYFT